MTLRLSISIAVIMTLTTSLTARESETSGPGWDGECSSMTSTTADGPVSLSLKATYIRNRMGKDWAPATANPKSCTTTCTIEYSPTSPRRLVVGPASYTHDAAVPFGTAPTTGHS